MNPGPCPCGMFAVALARPDEGTDWTRLVHLGYRWCACGYIVRPKERP